MRKQRIPAYSRASRDRAYVRIEGEWIGLGKYNSQASREKYDRVIQEWLAHGRSRPRQDSPTHVTVSQLLDAYLRHARDYYRGSTELPKIRQLDKIVRSKYGRASVDEFGPRTLKAVRQVLVEQKHTRKHVNAQVQRLRRCFKWGVDSEMVEARVYDALRCVEGLRSGRSEARESEPVRPVPVEHIYAACEHVPAEVAALLRLQLLTAARPGELVIMRPVDLDTTGKVWLYRPKFHKNTHRQKDRTIYIGPEGQNVLQSFLSGCAVDGYVFSPRRAIERKAKAAKTHRRKGQTATRRKTARTVGEHYSVDSYRRAVQRACDTNDIPAFSLHAIRHTAATRVRQEFGLEAAQLLCGHAKADITQLYAEANTAKALQVAQRIG